jgi:aminoethylphosphonate catabolism LysR family transcriptional regulator
MNYAALRAFHHVAQQGGVTRAAAALGLTQPTLSGQVKGLQARHGVRLFERRGRGVEPTELGLALHELTCRFFAVEDEIAEFLAAARDSGRGRLRLGADAPAHVIPALAAFNRRFPRMKLEVSLGNSQTILNQLLERRLDVAVIPDLARDKRLYAVPLRNDRLVALVPLTHEGAGRGRMRLGELARQSVVLREPGSRTRAVLQAALERAGVTIGEALEIGSREGVLEAVAAGLGVGVIFLSEFRGDERLKALDLTGAPTASREYVACLAGRRDAPSVEAFFEVAKSLAAGGRGAISSRRDTRRPTP